MDRRQFLKWTGIGSVMALAPSVALARDSKLSRVLLLVELKGGNDGLNTVIPFGDKAYARVRPDLAVARDQVLQLTGKVGLNPVLSPLMASWKGRDLAVVQGLGYPKPNRSHFRSIEIWETGSASDRFLSQGWLGRLLEGQLPDTHVAGGIVLGDQDAGPLAGDVRTLVMRNPSQFVRAARRMKGHKHRTSNRALAHVLAVQDDLLKGARAIEARMGSAERLGVSFPRGNFGKQLKDAARLLIGGVSTAAIKVSLGSFDTHANQMGTHRRLLTELGEGLAAFRGAMIKAGRWNDVLVTTYSEFGRRMAQNGSMGTDHGTAAPHFVMGGRVVGGLYGAQPSLTDLEGGDLKFKVDYRQLYTTIARDWWGLKDASLPGGRFAPLSLLR